MPICATGVVMPRRGHTCATGAGFECATGAGFECATGAGFECATGAMNECATGVRTPVAARGTNIHTHTHEFKLCHGLISKRDFGPWHPRGTLQI